MRTACYARFSSDLQRETSLEDQIRVCREQASAEGWPWQDDQVYTDAGISGASLEGRRGLQALLQAAEAQPRPFDVLLVDDSSRVSRDLADALRVMQRLRFAGVRVLYVAQHIDSASEQAETLVAVHGLVDGLYLREMAHKIRRGLAGQVERGFSTGGRRFGYRTVAVPDGSGQLDADGAPRVAGRRLVIVEEEAATIREVFGWYIAGTGVPTIVRRLNEAGRSAPRGAVSWTYGAVQRLLRNERYIGRLIWGQRRFERRPGTRRLVARAVPRHQWRVLEQPELRIIAEDVWAAAQARQAQVAAMATRQPGTSLMAGRNGALHSRHLFTGFMRCGLCGGAITVVSGGSGSPRYGCQRHSKNGQTACANRLTIRATVADAALLEGLQAELLRPQTLAYVSAAVSEALNALADAKPQERVTTRQQRDTVHAKLLNLVAAVEAGGASPVLLAAVAAREAELATLEARLVTLESPDTHSPMAVIPTWVRQQLEDAVSVLSDSSERTKLQFQRLGVSFTVSPVFEPGQRPFLRAVGAGDFELLAFSHHALLTTTQQSPLR